MYSRKNIDKNLNKYNYILKHYKTYKPLNNKIILLTGSQKVIYVLVKMIFLASMVDLNHKTKI